MSEADLRREAEEKVDERIRKWEEAEPPLKELYGFAGFLTYGEITLPREKQVENYVRSHQPTPRLPLPDLRPLYDEPEDIPLHEDTQLE